MSRSSVIAAILAVGVMSATPVGAGETVRIVNIGRGYWAGPLFVAERENLFEKHGLKAAVSTVKGGALALQALLSKEADVALLNYEHIVTAASKGRRVVAVYRMINRPVNNVIIRNELAAGSAGLDIGARVRRLKGLRVGLPSAAGSGEKMLGVLAGKHGLRLPGDITTVYLGGDPGSYVAAFKKGLIDAALPVEPAGVLVEQAGLGKIYINLMTGEVPEFDDLIAMVLAVHPDSTESKAGLIRKVTATFDEAMSILKNRPALAKEIMRKEFPNLEERANEQTYNTLRNIWTDKGRMNAEEGRRVQQYLGLEHLEVPIEQTFSNAFLPS